MDIEKQVVSLALAKRLKEIGIPQESLFYWVTTEMWDKECTLVTDGKFDPIDLKRMTIDEDSGVESESWRVLECYAAFTVAELGEMHRPFVKSSKRLGAAGGWFCHFDTNPLNIPGVPTHRKEIMADTEADARAKMLMYLTEQKRDG